MSKLPFLFSAFFIIALSAGDPLFAQEKGLLEKANGLYAAEKYVEAASVYEKLLGEAVGPNEKAKLMYGLGMSFVRLKRYAEAREQFRAILSMKVDNREPEGKNPNIFRNYHYNAQFAIAKMQFDAKDFEAALESFDKNRVKYPYLSNCGICLRDENLKLSLYEAATLEHLNRNKEAFGIYFRIGHPRLVEIYAANGQFEKFIRLTEKKSPAVPQARNYKDFFTAYEYSKSGKAAALMNELRRLSATAQDSYLKDFTARMLASFPREAVPLVDAELKNLKTYPYVFYRTLGFAATPGAVEILKTRAGRANGWFESESIVASLTLAGEAGEKALRELETQPLSRNMRLAIDKHKRGELVARNYLELDFASARKAELPDDF